MMRPLSPPAAAAHHVDSSSSRAHLDRFFAPASVAVIGATPNLEKIGGRLLGQLLKHGYAGAVYPINPSHGEIAGLTSYRTISEVPAPVDLALIAVPAAAVPQTLAACADAGVKAALICSSGFNEAGAEGVALQERVTEICARTGIRVAGPNSEGFYNIARSTAATFNVAIDVDKGDLDGAAQIGIVSQSGGLGFAFFNKGRRDDLLFSHIFSVGNQADLEIADYVAWLVEQEPTRVILAYAESLNDPARFFRAAERAAALGKPIVMVKVGNSAAATRAAHSHTGAIAGPAAVVDAALAHHGIVRADDQDHLLNLAAAFVRNPLPTGNRVGIVSVSGGTATWLADACVAAGLEVPELDPERRARIARWIPAFGASNNPVDVTAQASEGYVKSLETVGEAPYIDAIILAVNFAHQRRLIKDGRAMAEWMRRVGKPVLIYSYALPSEKSRQMMRELGLHCYTSLQGCVRSLRGLVDYAAFQRTRGERKAPQRAAADMPDEARKMLAAAHKVLCEYEARALLAAYGVDAAGEALAQTADEAVAHAERLGHPVALKVQSPDISHKTEARALKLGLADAAAVRSGFEEVLANARRHAPAAQIRGVLVQKTAAPGRELIAGIVNDGAYGPMVMVGWGGIYAEVLDAAALAPAPITPATARAMLERLRGYRLLTGVRGEPPRDVAAVADFLVRLSHLAWDARDVLAELDVNPLFVHEAGAGVTVVDALAIKK
jgi:acyl-CoA synthetase (NDP forming)